VREAAVDNKPETKPVKKFHSNEKHYKVIGNMIRDAMERNYGKDYKKCFSQRVAQALVAKEAFFMMMGGAREGMDATTLEEHGRQCYNYGLKACGLEDEDEG
jgi:hypothetical protein